MFSKIISTIVFLTITSMGFSETAEFAVQSYVSEYMVAWTTNDQITIGSGKLTDQSNSEYIISTNDLICDITVSGTNGLDADSETSNTWYHLYICSDAGIVYSMLSTNPVTPVGPSLYRRLGAFRNDANSNLLKFTCIGVGRRREIRLANALTLLDAGADATFTDVDCSSGIPPTSTVGYFAFVSTSGSGVLTLSIRPNGSSSAWTTRVRANKDGSFMTYEFTDSAQIIEYEIDSGSAFIYLLGYLEDI